MSNYITKIEYECINLALRNNERLAIHNDYFNICTKQRGVIFSYANWTTLYFGFDKEFFLAQSYEEIIENLESAIADCRWKIEYRNLCFA